MRKNLFVCGLSAILFGCSSSDDFPGFGNTNSNINRVVLSAEPVVFEDIAATRTSLTVSSTGLDFSWAEGDTIGLFPIEPTKGSQVYQVLNTNESEGGELTASFDGGAWKLKQGNTYASYYPFQHGMKVSDPYDAVPITMLGQKQNGKGTSGHLGKYDILYAASTPVTTGTANFNFKHVPGFALLRLTMPAGSWKKIVLLSESESFVTSAKMNVTNGTLSSKTMSDSIVLDLQNVTTTANEVVDFYMVILPTVTGKIELTAYTTSNKEYNALLDSKEVKSGKGRLWTATLSVGDAYAGLPYVDLGVGSLWGRENVNISNGNNPEYYAWAGLGTQDSYTWSTYRYSNGPTKDYITTCIPGDGYAYLEPSTDDVAYISMGEEPGRWMIPTKYQFEQLLAGCDWKWTLKGGVYGYKVSHKQNPFQYIFLPVCGVWTTSKEEPDAGYYWTSDVETDNSKNWSEAYCLKIDQNTHAISTMERCKGLSIRPIYIGQ